MSVFLNPAVYADKTRQLLSDPDLHDDPLLFALAVVEHKRQLDLTTRTRLAGFDYREVARIAFGADPAELPEGLLPRRVASAIRRDAPRYQPPGAPDGCPAPLVRKPGLCGQRVRDWALLRDPATGEAQSVGHCSRHWSHDMRDRANELARQWRENGCPEPAPNTGGVLARHFPKAMPALYAHVAPRPGRPPREPTPQLRVVRSCETSSTPAPPRPRLGT